MKNKVKNIIISFSFLGALLFLMIASIIAPDIDISKSERRSLLQLPELSWDTVVNKDQDGDRYFDNLEEYLLDQFVWRDGFRTINSVTRRYAFMQKDVNDIFVLKGNVFSMYYQLNEKAVEQFASTYLKIISRYFSKNGANIYFTIVPDKSYYGSEDTGYLSIDYDKLYSIMQEKLSDHTYIEIRDLLDINDYYKTDLHWDQSKIIDVANKILTSMGKEGNLVLEDFEQKKFEGFEGSYYGQAALPLKKDTLTYLTNEMLENCKVSYLDDGAFNKTGKISFIEVPMYAEEKLGGVDSYDVFLWGARSLVQIENPACDNDKELVIFRDSFGSSLAPLLASEYSKITILDLRYVKSDFVGFISTFSDNCDVLFMYNSALVNTPMVIF